MVKSTPEELELTVLSSIKSLEDYAYCLSQGIREDSFQIDEYANVWRYYEQHSLLGRFPSPEDVSANCNVILMEGLTDLETPVDTLSKISMRRRASTIMLDRGKDLISDPEKAIQNLIGDLSEITKGQSAHSVLFDADATSRLDEIRRRTEAKSRGEYIGIPTGLLCFDEKGDTWRPGEMAAILGTTNVGKSWLLCYFAAYAYYYSNKRVLFLSPEDTTFEIEARIDPIISRFMGIELSNKAIRNGFVDMKVYEGYLKELTKSGRKDFKVRDSGDAGVFSIGDIVSQSREFRPDILAIDGFHLIKGVGKSWENVKEAAESIKGLAQHMGMVVIAGCQAQREAAMAIDDTPELGQAAYGMGLMEACNRVITLVEKRGDKKQRIFKVPKFRSGAEKIVNRQYLRFDVDLGDIGQVIPAVDEETGEVNW